MYDIRIESDPAACRELWRRAFPEERVWDNWGMRACFSEHFRRPFCFITCEVDGTAAVLPLSWVEESQCYEYFPGETWGGKTWLEQNRLPRGDGLLSEMLEFCPGPYYLRYLDVPSESAGAEGCEVDEIGYLFRPSDYGYDMEKYFERFSRKSARNIKHEVFRLGAGASYRLDDTSDFEHLVELNLTSFGEHSYFYDERFLESFRSLMHYLNERGWLRITTVLINGDVAAVDIGCVYRDVYTLLGGGTNREYRGVAKLINLYHMERGCRERFREIDFLCGDFSWKEKFHLSPRPLYLLSNCMVGREVSEDVELRGAGHVE